MSRFNRYNNIHDPDDDGADIEITPPYSCQKSGTPSENGIEPG